MDRASIRSPVCRRLFANEEEDEPLEGAAPGAQEQAAQDRLEPYFERRQEQLLQEQREAARLKWNFDFETETPLEGDWEWERVPPQQQPEPPQQQACAPRVQVQQQEPTCDPGNKSL